jgi:hypothetical protein
MVKSQYADVRHESAPMVKGLACEWWGRSLQLKNTSSV